LKRRLFNLMAGMSLILCVLVLFFCLDDNNYAWMDSAPFSGFPAFHDFRVSFSLLSKPVLLAPPAPPFDLDGYTFPSLFSVLPRARQQQGSMTAR